MCATLASVGAHVCWFECVSGCGSGCRERMGHGLLALLRRLRLVRALCLV